MLLIDQKTFKEEGEKTPPTVSVAAAIRDVRAAVPLESGVVERSYREFVEQRPPPNAAETTEVPSIFDTVLCYCTVGLVA